MITLGIDLAADEKKTGVARVSWFEGGAVVTDVAVGADDATLVDAMLQAEKTGIDCPLGWPRKFIDFIVDHRDDHVVIEADAVAQDWRRELSYRETDLWVRSKVKGIQGLSVSSDRIGVTTMRCAALMSQLASLGHPVDRAGAGPVVEVYPAASLVLWGHDHRGYKGSKGAAGRHILVDKLCANETWLDFGGFGDLCRRSDDALDAVLAALTARAAVLGHVHDVPAEKLQAAEREGWIALPNDTIRGLASQ